MSVQDQVGKTLAGWQLGSLLGQGGMGAVFRAKHLATGREGAFKLVTGGSSQAAARLRRETELLTRLSHPGLARVLAAGVLPDGRPYYVMELVPGRGLDAVVAEEAPVEAKRAARLVAGAARALGHAHAQAIVHRDVKPSNIIVRPDGSPVVLDFGLAKAILEDEAERLSRTGQLLGTVHYMSPEQATGGNTLGIGPPSDVFSLGVVLYELLTGERPFEGATAIEVIARISTASPTPVRDRVPGLPRALDSVVAKAMSLEPAARYPDALALALDLERFLAGKSVEAKTHRGPRRGRRVLLGGVALAVLAPLAALVVQAARSSPVPDESASSVAAHAAAVSLAGRTRELAEAARLADGADHPAPARRGPVEDEAQAAGLLAAKLPPGEPARVELSRAIVQTRAALLALEPPSDVVLARIQTLEGDLAGAPEPALLSAVRGLALAGHGRAPAAIGSLERALAAVGTEREPVLDFFPPPRLEEALAAELLTAGRAADAVAVLDRVLPRSRSEEHSPASARRRLLRARARQSLRQFELAVADVEAAEPALEATNPRATRDPAFALSFVEKGRALLAAGHDEDAVRAFLEAGARDVTAFPPDLAPRAAAAIEKVSTERLRQMTQATSPAERPTAERVRAQHAALDLALDLDPSREKAPAGLVSLEKILCQTAEPLHAVRFLVAARFRRLGIPFDAKEDLYMMRAADGQWGSHEKTLRDRLAAAGGDARGVGAAYVDFCHAVRPNLIELAYEAEEEWRPRARDEALVWWYRERGMTLLKLRRVDEAFRSYDQAVEGALARGDEEELEAELFWRGTSLREVGRYPEAVRDLSQTIEMRTRSGRAPNGFPWMDLAISLHGLHREEEALSALQGARAHGGMDELTTLEPLEGSILDAMSKRRR